MALLSTKTTSYIQAPLKYFALALWCMWVMVYHCMEHQATFVENYSTWIHTAPFFVLYPVCGRKISSLWGKQSVKQNQIEKSRNPLFETSIFSMCIVHWCEVKGWIINFFHQPALSVLGGKQSVKQNQIDKSRNPLWNPEIDFESRNPTWNPKSMWNPVDFKISFWNFVCWDALWWTPQLWLALWID